LKDRFDYAIGSSGGFSEKDIVVFRPPRLLQCRSRWRRHFHAAMHGVEIDARIHSVARPLAASTGTARSFAPGVIC
jgi:hypothetical protein